MKKILCVFMVFALIFSLGACKKDKDNSSSTAVETEVVTDDYGEPVTNENGETMVTEISTATPEIVTNDNGQPVTNKSGETITVTPSTSKPEIVTNGKGQPVTNKSGETITVAPTAAATTEPVSFISDETMPIGQQVEVPTAPGGYPANPLIGDSFFNILKGEKYSIRFTAQMDMDGSKQTMPAAIYVSGKKSLIELTIGDAGLGLGLGLGKMSVLNNGTEKYLLIDILKLLKGYIQIPADQASEYDTMFDFSGFSDTSDMTYVKTTKVTYKGVEYIAEEYRSSDATIKFFFNNGKLKRIEQVSDDGSTVFMENIVISATFNESVFNIPAGYKQISEKDLESLSGLLG